MHVRTLINSFLIILLYSITVTTDAGSSATAITTISANIVPAASFTVSSPILLNQGSVDRQRLLSSKFQQGIASKITSSNGLNPGPTVTGKATRLSVESSKNLVYDVSLSPQINATDNGSHITAKIRHSLENNGQTNSTEEFKLEIDGSLTGDKSQDTGAYRGLIDITVNYN